MIRKRHVFNESVEDPCELLVSLVDIGAVDIEDAFLACTCEMSPAQCKRVLSKCGTGFNCEENEDTYPADSDVIDEDDIEEPEDDDMEEMDDDDADDEVDELELDDEDEAATELEARIRRLERCTRHESVNRNRISRFSRRK